MESLSPGDPERIGDHTVRGRPGQGAQPGAGQPAQAQPAQAGLTGSATFRTTRLAPLLWSAAYLGGALLCGSTARLADQHAERGAAALFGWLFWFLLAVAAYRLWLGCRRTRTLQVSAAGLVAARGTREVTLPWSHLARVRVVRRAQRAWLVAWPADPGTPTPGFRTSHGGLLLYPIRHEQGRRARDHETRELRAALLWYGHGHFDPNA